MLQVFVSSPFLCLVTPSLQPQMCSSLTSDLPSQICSCNGGHLERQFQGSSLIRRNFLVGFSMASTERWLVPRTCWDHVCLRRFGSELQAHVFSGADGHVRVSPPVQTCNHELGHVIDCVLVRDCDSHATRCAIQHDQEREGKLPVTVFAPSEERDIRLPT